MIVNRVILYKTPLDSNYENVIDIVNHSNMYPSINDVYGKVLYDRYEKKVIDTPSIRSIKLNYRDGFITLNEDFDIIRDFNYIGIRSDDGWKYFFITNMVSLNDGNNPSTQLFISYDVWANNLEVLLNSKMVTQIECKHFDRFKLEGGELVPTPYNINITPPPQINSTFKFNDKRVLFLVLEMNEQFQNINDKYFTIRYRYTINGVEYGTSISTTVHSQSSFNRYMKYMLYIPFKVYDYNTDKLYGITIPNSEITFDLTPLLTEGNTGEFTFIQPNRDVNISYIGEGIGSYIQKAYLTYYPPIKYNIGSLIDDRYEVSFTSPLSSISLDGKNLVPVFTDIEPLERDLEGIPQEIVIDGVNIFSTVCGLLNYHMGDSIIYGDELAHRISIEDIFNLSIYEDKNRFNTSGQYNSDIDPNFHNNPYLNFIFTFNNKEFTYSLRRNDYPLYLSFYIDYTTSQPLLKIYEDYGEELIPYGDPKGYYLSNSGLVTYSADALDSYIIRNGAQHSTSEWIADLTRLNALFNIFSINVGMSSNGITASPSSLNGSSMVNAMIADEKYRMYDAKLYDLSQTPSDYHSYSGENDFLYQDRIQFYLKIPTQNISDRVLKDELYKYGYNIPVYDNPFSNNRKYFDYVKCVSVEFTEKVNEYDKSILTNILNRGVFKNHITLLVPGDAGHFDDYIYVFNDSLIKDSTVVNNIEFKFDTEQNYIDWRNS